MNWIDKHLGGHWQLGPITIYGQNAMHWGVDIKLPRCYISFRLPFRCFQQWWPLYFYISNNATPSNATVLFGKYSIEAKVSSTFRRNLLGVFYNKPETARTEQIIHTETRTMLQHFVKHNAKEFETDTEYLDCLLDEIQIARLHIDTYTDPETETDYTRFNFINNNEKFADVKISEDNFVRISYRRCFANNEIEWSNPECAD